MFGENYYIQNILEWTYSLIINKTTRSLNIVAGWSKTTLILKHVKSDISAGTFQQPFSKRAIFENGFWNVLAKISDFMF